MDGGLQEQQGHDNKKTKLLCKTLKRKGESSTLKQIKQTWLKKMLTESTEET